MLVETPKNSLWHVHERHILHIVEIEMLLRVKYIIFLLYFPGELLTLQECLGLLHYLPFYCFFFLCAETRAAFRNAGFIAARSALGVLLQKSGSTSAALAFAEGSGEPINSVFWGCAPHRLNDWNGERGSATAPKTIWSIDPTGRALNMRVT